MPLLDATLAAFGLLFAGDAALWRIVWVSLKTSVAGLLLAAPPAVVMGYLVASHRFRGRRLVIWLTQASLCLLYTSPSPRDRQKSRMPSSA